jgi:hypothetical protein
MASDVVLYEGQLTTTPASVYTAPLGEQVKIVAVQLVNITGTAATARIDRVPAGGTDGTTEEVYNGSVAANATVGLPVAGESIVTVLQHGDQLFVSSGTATAIDCTISGEIESA